MITRILKPEHLRDAIDRLSERPSAFTRWHEGDLARAAVLEELLKPSSRLWEVLDDTEDLALKGILRLSRIRPGNDAVLDFSFFDNRLSDKTELLESLVEESFADHNDWTALKRLKAELPAHAFSLIRTFSRLGFGGQFPVRLGNAKVKVDAIIPTANEMVGALVIMGLDNG